jgi:hypothetical protein
VAARVRTQQPAISVTGFLSARHRVPPSGEQPRRGNQTTDFSRFRLLQGSMRAPL